MIDVKQTLQDSEEKMEMAALYLEEELNRIRAGRANVAILDCVRVDSYGSKVPFRAGCKDYCHQALGQEDDPRHREGYYGFGGRHYTGEQWRNHPSWYPAAYRGAPQGISKAV